MSILRTINGAAVLVFGLYAGVWADRFRRRPTMIAADMGRALVLAAIPLAAFFHSLSMPLLYVVTAIAGILTVFFDVAYQSYLPALVARENVLEGNSKLALSTSIAEIAGPGLTGVLVQILTAPVAILFDAVSFLFSAMTVAVIRKPESFASVRTQERPLDEAVRGLKFIWSHRMLRPLAAHAATAYFCFGIFGPVYVLYAIRNLGFSALQLQAAIMAGGVAAMTGSLAAHRTGKRFGLGATFIGTGLLIGAGAFLIPLAQAPLPLALVMIMASQFICDFHMVVYNVQELTLRQTVAPDHMLGRVNGCMRLLTFGVMPIGSLAGGALASAFGIRPTMFLAASGLLLAPAWLVFSPLRRVKQLQNAAALRAGQGVAG